MYSCSNNECFGKKLSSNQLKNDEILIPLRLMVCGHSVCELCVLQLCKQNSTFIKCSICGFNTNITESVSRNVIQYETDIKKWLDSSGSVGQVLRMELNLFPLDLYSIATAVDSGLMTATKTPLLLDVIEDDDVIGSTDSSAINESNACNSLTEDNTTVNGIMNKIKKDDTKRFVDSVTKGGKTFIDLAANYISIKRTSDQTKEWFKKMRTNTKETFHKMHSIMQLREKELLEEIDANEEQRLQDLRVYMNEILSKRCELKRKLLNCDQIHTDREKLKLGKAIEQLAKDSNVMHLNTPQNEFKLLFDSTIESKLKVYGTVERNDNSGHEDSKMNTEEDIREIDESERESPISVSSDDEDISFVSTEGEQSSRQIADREVVTVLINSVKSPFSFYVQKASDKERFEYLKSEITKICSSAYFHAPAIETLGTGERLFAYSLLNMCWCRATLTHYSEVKDQENEFEAKVSLIDYGVEEIVKWYNIREKKSELFDDKKWPPFAYKCTLFNIKPNTNTSSRDRKTESLALFHRYVDNNQLVMFLFENKNGYDFVDLIHYDVPDVSYQIPSLIEIFVNYEYATITGNIDFSSYSRYKKCQSLNYPDREMPKTLRTVSVLVSHVESPDLFYVQLQREHNILLKLIDELNETYNAENAGIYTYYNPKLNTPCAALFDGDKRFYRALIVSKGKYFDQSVVQFVDFGNKQEVKNINLRLIKNSMIQRLPIQSISCYLIHVEPAYGFKWTEAATDAFKIAISNDRGPQILTMVVYEVDKKQRLGVVLRSYDGNNGLKINEVLVNQKHAVSIGSLSLPDNNREDLRSSQESLNSLNSCSSSRNRVQTSVTMPYKVSALIILKEMFERNKTANKRSSLIKVIVTSVRNPTDFYVQIDKDVVNKYLQDIEKLLHEEYSSLRYKHLGDINFIVGDVSAFKVDNYWKRGRVIERLNNLTVVEVPEEQRFKVMDIDYGVEYDLKVSQMRRLNDDFTKDGSFALNCRLASLRPTGGSIWSHSARDVFKDEINKFKDSLYILVKQNEIIDEPISVKLYARETKIPGAFEKIKTFHHNLSQLLINKGFAIFDRNNSSMSGSESETDDDNQINEETSRESRTEMPFSLYSQNDGNVSVLESLQLREQQTSDKNTQTGKFFKYLDEEYPSGERMFWAIPTDLDTADENFSISFRYWKEGDNVCQPLRAIEESISDMIHSRGELEPFRGPFTKDNACTAYFDFDHSWNRAEIVGIARKSTEDHFQLIVRFVDYGNKDSILVDKLSSQVFGREVPKLALKCRLFDINPISDDKIEAIRNEIYTKVLDKKCKFVWENYPELPMKVSVEIPHQNTYVSFKSVLIEKKLIIDEEIVANINEKRPEDILRIESLVKNTYGLYPVKFDSSKFYSVVISHPLVDNYAFFQANEIRKPVNEEEMINEEHDNFIWMLEEMRSNINSNKLLKDIKKGMACCAHFSDDFWYRGLVIGVDNHNMSAEIFFIDYGNIDWVPFNRIREIKNKHLKPCAHAFFCQLYNVRPRSNYLWSKRKDITNEMIEHLSEISNEETLFAKFKSCESFPYKIDLYKADEENNKKPGKHALHDFISDGRLEFIKPNEVWRKTIQLNTSFRNRTIKSEPIN